MIDPESTHREAVLTVAYRLMSGRRTSLARLGELRTVHESARKQGTAWYPPAERVIFDPSRTRGEDEPPSAVDFLSREIRSRLAEHGRARMDGLGVFSSEDGEVRFSAASDLQHVVNHAYAHLESHEQPLTKEGAFAVTEETASKAEPEGTTGNREPDSTETPPIPPVSTTVPPVASEPSEITEPSEPSEITEPSEPSEITEPKKIASQARRPGSTSLRDRRAAQHNIRPWVVALLIAIPLLAIGVYVVVEQSDMESRQDDVAVTEHAPVNPVETPATDSLENVVNAADVENAANEESSGLLEDPAAAAPAAVTSDNAPRNPTTFLARGMAGYTLITASTSQQASAAAQLQSLSRLNLPAGVLYFETEDGPRYRAAVGQWPSAAAADSARQALSDDLPRGTWVKRLN